MWFFGDVGAIGDRLVSAGESGWAVNALILYGDFALVGVTTLVL
jgi:hypothetical protein